MDELVAEVALWERAAEIEAHDPGMGMARALLAAVREQEKALQERDEAK